MWTEKYFYSTVFYHETQFDPKYTNTFVLKTVFIGAVRSDTQVVQKANCHRVR